MKVQQQKPRFGLRPSTDSLVLCRLVKPKRGERIADLGSGFGNIAMNLAARFKVECHGFELQEPLHQAALENLNAHNAELKGTVQFHLADVRKLAHSVKFSGYFDLIVMNPPWYRKGSGRLSPDPVRAAATHELEGRLSHFLAAARRLLRADGQCYLILIAQREDELHQELQKQKPGPDRLSVVSLRPIKTHAKRPPKWIVFKLRKGRSPRARRLQPLDMVP